MRVADTKHQREVEVSTYIRTNVVSAPSPMYQVYIYMLQYYCFNNYVCTVIVYLLICPSCPMVCGVMGIFGSNNASEVLKCHFDLIVVLSAV